MADLLFLGCDCCNAVDCDFSCPIPDPVCITTSACGETLILDSPTLESYVQFAANYCKYSGCAALTFDDTDSDVETCSWDTRLSVGPDDCVLDPGGSYSTAVATVGSIDYYYTLVKTGQICTSVVFDPILNRMRIIVTVSVSADVYLTITGSYDVYTSDTCPLPPVWVFDRTETVDYNIHVFDNAATTTYSLDVEVDCEVGIFDDYIVECVDGCGSGISVSGSYDFSLLAGLGTCDTLSPTYDFGSIGCGPAVANVTIASGPCSTSASPSFFGSYASGDYFGTYFGLEDAPPVEYFGEYFGTYVGEYI